MLPVILALCLVQTPDAGARTPCALVIGVDGLRPDCFGAGRTPRMDALIARGSSPARAVNAWTHELPRNGHSATNWGVLLTGVSPERSELTRNDDREHRVGRDNPDAWAVETMFGHLKSARPAARTGVTNTWAGIRDEDWTILGRDASAIDWWHHPEGDAPSAERDVENVDRACAEVAAGGGDAGGELVFVHLSQCDAAGHAHTYGSPGYAEAVGRVDALVGRLLDAVDARERRAREAWLVLVTSDHGGPLDGTGHADNDDPEVHAIPFVLAADGVAPGRELGVPSLFDVTPTVLGWMGLEVDRLGLAGCDLLARAPAAELLVPAQVRFSDVTGIGREPGVVRRDPSDVIEVAGVHHVWYTKVVQSELPPELEHLRTSGYAAASIWHAWSDDGGHSWTERGPALAPGEEGRFDALSVFTPNVLPWQGRYHLYYTAVRPSAGGGFRNDASSDPTAIGVAVADSPMAGFERVIELPVLTPSATPERFDSYRVDDASLLVRDFDRDGELEIGLYYKGRSLAHGADGPARTSMGLATACAPEGPFQRWNEGQPLLYRSHEVLVWEHAGGVAALASQSRTLELAPDGTRFRTLGPLEPRPNAPGLFRAGWSGRAPPGLWGIDMVHDHDAPYLRRFELTLRPR